MRVVVVSGKALELNYMWLPTWLGQNGAFKQELEKDLAKKIAGRPITADSLDEINTMVIDYICEKYKVPGLFDYLDGLKFVEM